MKFKCKQTKNVYEFTQDVDIKAMLEHPEYEVVEEQEKPVVVEKKPVKTKG
jgi:hypothetical protein